MTAISSPLGRLGIKPVKGQWIIVARVTIVFGLILSALGLYGYFGTGMKSLTPLLPAIPAIIILVCGIVALNKAKETVWTMAAQMLTFITLIVCLPNISKLPDVFAGVAERPFAVWLAVGFAALSLLYLLITIPMTLQRKEVSQQAII